MKRIISFICVLVVGTGILFNIGCAAKKTTSVYTSSPETGIIDTDLFSISLKPVKFEGSRLFTYFMLSLQNRSSQGIEIDWNRTRYIQNGNNEGGVYFAEIKPADIKAKTIPNTVVQAGLNMSMAIAPMSRVAQARLRQQTVFAGTSFYPGMLPTGENAIVLALKHGDQQISQKLSVHIKEEVITK